MKSIPSALQTHRNTLQTTQCFLLKIVPQNTNTFGITNLDQAITYDDGGGDLVYTPGMDLSSLESSSTLSVNNAEATILTGDDFSPARIRSGVFDYARFYLYRINWSDTSQGHSLEQSGTTGIVRTQNDLAGIMELRSLAQQLKQNYNDLYSLSCRARFGSQPSDGYFTCGFDASSLLQALTVSAVGTETDREFTASGTPSASGPNGALPFDVAQITFTSGANNGLTVETEYVSGTSIALRFPAPYAIEVGDTFNIRPDCQKRYAEDCIALYDNHLNFRGEPWIPVTEEAPGQFPGASRSGLGSSGGTPDPVNPPPTTPDPAPDISGAVTWESWFGKPFGSPLCDATRVIPYGGIAIWFQVPITSDVVGVSFASVEVTGGITTTVTGTVNTGVLDFSTPPKYSWGIGGGITGGINNPGQDIDLVPGNIYIFNIKNDSPNEPNWRRLQVHYNVS